MLLAFFAAIAKHSRLFLLDWDPPACAHRLKRNKRYNTFRFESSDADSDILESAESESKRLSLSHAQVRLFDKSMMLKRRRYIERRLDLEDDDSGDDVCDDLNNADAGSDACDEDLNDDEFVELFRTHVKRKKMRKKIRANPEVRPYLIFLFCI